MSANSLRRTNDDVELTNEGGFLAGKKEIPAWALSLVLHLAVLFVLFSITYSTGVNQNTIITSAIDDIDPDTYKFDASVEDMIGSGADANMIGSTQAAAEVVAKDPRKEVEKPFEMLTNLQVPETTSMPQISQAEMRADLDNPIGANEVVGGVEGAIDRLTMEIAASLKERKTLAIWMFDASLSLNERREEIASRFENVYRQLGMLDVGADKALKTAVVSYGEKTDIMTPEPVDDVKDLVKAVRNIKPDESGKENVFAAIDLVVGRFASYRSSNKLRRNVMIILVTDERGDDYNRLEEVVQKTQRLGMRVYCVGHASIFGREQGFVKWKYADGTTEDLPVDQGPETVAPERLQLAFWGVNGYDLERISSGYGPYALTRLCAETGGLYLITDESQIRFDPAVMRNYPPDYRPIRDYEADLTKNLAKGALVNAAVSTKVGRIPTPQLAFRADTDNVLRTEITEAQKPAAVLDHRLNEILEILSAGEKDRPKLDTPRWRASYDLAMGRILAMRVRAFGYNTVLAEMKVSPKPFETKGSNQWRLEPSTEITAGPAVKKLATKAQEYLTRVIDEHPGTPWATLAERELSKPMGWNWKEATVALASNGMRGNDKNNPQFAEEEKKRKEREKKMSGPPKARPKL